MGIHIVKELQIITLMGHDAYLHNISTFSFLLFLRKTYLPLGHHPGYQVEGYQNLNYYSYNEAFREFYDSNKIVCFPLEGVLYILWFCRQCSNIIISVGFQVGYNKKNICLYEIHQILKVHLRPGRDLNYRPAEHNFL